ncbi:sulfurtransferase [Alkalibacillus haloalkaliphilus]|uniref:Thiosulfate sulfurtransferase n=1 Tax=Alkalibacillus haloalkaliphilus TaxID=94136 RepID=A0A511W2W7_9BACI|nr:sulfurtransferase [Alkalibacillus haloalkaliphilus]GEN45111.1 thiosulfate sulfurtransferase [Alkalibacillus haloalkaliphilus]
MLVSVQEAKTMYEELGATFVDCRFDLQDDQLGFQNYEAFHLPGAVYLHLEQDLSGSVEATGGRHPLPHLDSFVQTLKAKGIDDETVIIAYDDNHAFASRFAWMMKAIGHQQVYILNGGIKAWRNMGYPLSTEKVERSIETSEQSWVFDENLIATQEYVRRHIEDEQIALIDSRNYDRFIGKVEPIDVKAGHIPSAKNFDWMNLFKEDGLFKHEDELKTYFSSLEMYKEIIVYCGSGVTAAPNVIALWEAGYNNVKLYVGSFSDWITNEDNEVMTFEEE